jgi:hypothetical protein
VNDLTKEEITHPLCEVCLQPTSIADAAVDHLGQTELLVNCVRCGTCQTLGYWPVEIIGQDDEDDSALEDLNTSSIVSEV